MVPTETEPTAAELFARVPDAVRAARAARAELDFALGTLDGLLLATDRAARAEADAAGRARQSPSRNALAEAVAGVPGRSKPAVLELLNGAPADDRYAAIRPPAPYRLPVRSIVDTIATDLDAGHLDEAEALLVQLGRWLGDRPHLEVAHSAAAVRDWLAAVRGVRLADRHSPDPAAALHDAGEQEATVRRRVYATLGEDYPQPDQPQPDQEDQ